MGERAGLNGGVRTAWVQGKGRERKGKEGKGRERKGKEGKGRERMGKEGKRKGKEGKGTSTLHCQGKNGRSKKIGQTNQKMIHFVPNMYVSGKISALRPGTQTVMIFGTTKKIRKLPKTTRFQDLRVFCGVLRVLSPVV